MILQSVTIRGEVVDDSAGHLVIRVPGRRLIEVDPESVTGRRQFDEGVVEVDVAADAHLVVWAPVSVSSEQGFVSSDIFGFRAADGGGGDACNCNCNCSSGNCNCNCNCNSSLPRVEAEEVVSRLRRPV